jgi:branched-chain amino acid transport system ATP-binding protein
MTSVNAIAAQDPNVAVDLAGVPMLELVEVHAAYGQIDVLHGVNLRLDAGSVLAVLGANGAGKSTTVRVISGLMRPTSGRLLLNGHDVTGASADALARAGVCVVPEGRGIFPRLSVEDHLRLAAPDRGSIDHVMSVAFEHFPQLRERRKQTAGTLSGGEQQMLALARAVARNPPLLVIDELSMGLAPLIVSHLYEHVRSLADSGVSIVVVEQFAHDVLGVADRAVVMQHGHVVRTGSPDELAGELADLYLATSASGADHGAGGAA